jgi:hypothetical protein
MSVQTDICEEYRERGEFLVLDGEIYRSGLPVRQMDSVALIAYWNSQRKIVDLGGKCAGGCQCELVQHQHKKHLVCPHTYEPCPRRVSQEESSS